MKLNFNFMIAHGGTMSLCPQSPGVVTYDQMQLKGLPTVA
jgi:hypothetical protein